jgi:predicted MFS family arabinose efflux permease
MVIFSFCSVLSGLAASFGTLLASRVVMGAVEGPFLPICLAIIAAASAQCRRGLNVGIVQNFFGSLIGTAIAPLVLVWIADHYGWRSAFYLAAIPGLLLALLVWRFVREPAMPPRPEGEPRAPLDLGMLVNRNIAVCSLLSCLMVGSLVIGSIFLPLFFTGPRGWEPRTMSFVMAVLGLTPGLGGVLVSWVSDRVGRRPPMIFGCFLAAICPFAALYFGGSIPALAAIMFLSWLGIGVFPLFMGIVPAETMGHAKAATAMGLVVGIGELSGGFLGPLIGGKLADLYGLQAPLLIQGALAVVAGFVAFALVETNPRVLARRAEGAVA